MQKRLYTTGKKEPKPESCQTHIRRSIKTKKRKFLVGKKKGKQSRIDKQIINRLL